ncbi:aminoglycoside phosphotransferase family protein [Acidaminobacter sp. JC074]|uniref:phosphotransferase family protein n=1 Tax=Acidaminobacter sp. JC074 TaxID=2530199 RepID=UPI001F0D8F86|nr:aminoglycoside phosphotransferase family protein [Acidaminobacter sp. JC074]MCH4888004.1 aminoglycoside phosphotransferase family protein [Acidaminobacter sp. JC074]
MILIGSGEFGNVFRIEPGRVVKLFDDSQYLEMEFRTCKYIGDQTPFGPKVYNRVDLSGRSGYEMEEIMGDLLLDRIEETSLNDYGLLMGKCHREVHDYNTDHLTLYNIHDIMEKHIERLDNFSQEDKLWLHEILKSLPRGKSLLHGDFMPYNLICSDQGLKALDWSDAVLGPAEADIARTLYFIIDPHDHDQAAYKSSNKFIEAYLNGYYGNKTTMGIIRKWLLLNVVFEYDQLVSEGQNTFFTERLKNYISNNKQSLGSDNLF